MSQSITFHGAARTVTGSRHLLRLNNKLVLVDCGLFQGGRDERERNWQPFPVDPHTLDAVVITHSHTDHIGYLPRLVALGYKGPIYATPASIGIARISLPDGGRLQEEDARYANKRGSRHSPALPLFTEKDAYASLKQFKPVRYGEDLDLPGGALMRFHPAGHILGSAMAEVFFKNGERILMSGDLGRYNAPIIRDPATIESAEHLVMESTYGDRLHEPEDPLDRLESLLRFVWNQGSALIVPSFAIGRTQELLFYLRRLQDAGRMPRVPIYIDSPMAVSVTHLYRTSQEEHDPDMLISLAEGRSELEPEGVAFVRDREQSKALNANRGPLMIISGSGMANGGRIRHHLLQRLTNPNNVILFTGYQAEGTLGRRLLEGESPVLIHRQEVHVAARVERLYSLSAHADYREMLTWLGGFRTPPRQTFLVHGEPPAQEALKIHIERELGWSVVVPDLHQSFDL